MFNTARAMLRSISDAIVTECKELKYTVPSVDKVMDIVVDTKKKSGLDINLTLVEDRPPLAGIVAGVDADDQSTIYVFEQTLQGQEFANELKRLDMGIKDLMSSITAHEIGHTLDTEMVRLTTERTDAIMDMRKNGINTVALNKFHLATIQLEMNAHTLGRPYAINKQAYEKFNEDNIKRTVDKYKEELSLYGGKK